MEKVIAGGTDLQGLLRQLRQHAGERLGAAEAEKLMAFAAEYFHRYPLEELTGRPMDDVFGALLHIWRFLGNYSGPTPRIEVFNPDLERDGWLCPHTLLLVLQRDMPFLVDSVRIELNRRNIAIHAIKSTLLKVQRDKDGALQSLAAGGNKLAEHEKREALISLEIGLHTDGGALRDLAEALQDVLGDVEFVVADHAPMLERSKELENNLAIAACGDGGKNATESREFLRWLQSNNFTFLGYTEFALDDEGGQRTLRELPERRLGLFRRRGGDARCKSLDDASSGVTRFHQAPEVLTFSKSSVRARVHRQAYSDYIVVKTFDDKGRVRGEARLLGLYTSQVYLMSPSCIPLIRDNVAWVFEKSGLDPSSHDGKALQQILETFPRDELFQSTRDELYHTVTGVAAINERYTVRLFMRPDAFGKFVNCLVYVPRDVFSTKVRQRIQRLIGEAINAEESDFTTWFSESILARVHMVFRLSKGSCPDLDVQRLQAEIVEITRTWEDRLLDALLEAHGEEQALQLLESYREAFPAAYIEHFQARNAVHDIRSIAGLREHNLAMSFYQPAGSEAHIMRFKVFHRGAPLELSDMIPILEHLGLRVMSEHPYRLQPEGQAPVWLHDFELSYDRSSDVDVSAVRQQFQDAFAAIWRGDIESDAFNRLVLAARINWREVALLRAYSCYMRQTLFNFTESYIAGALVNHVSITRNLVALFKACFDPRLNQGREADVERIERLKAKIIEGLDQVPNLNEDRIIRRYLAMVEGTLRTNFFRIDGEGNFRGYLSMKFAPRRIPDIPEPRPLYEIFVYSPRVEGVHLRQGRVARGGLRWSDRLQDYRTEVLGLVKAQQVKNAVIVPNGAKGGFVCKKLPSGGGREALQQEAMACYQTFIRGLLDITDNLVAGEVAPPDSVVCFDGDDPYLVVAADKGTATFSDIANALSDEYGFWLGDAFASGGSQGYDHKAMGITARGAWVAVQRHFRELGVNIQEEDFTVVGIGDMSGDVFGNGMLLSRHICLVAAFNHQHIFIDPDPDPEKSFAERRRLFALPRSQWTDYNQELLSEGGGIFSRDLKTIVITPAMKRRFDIVEDRLTPAELINALLQAPVDLIWNGGIGTYVKAGSESHEAVGDKTNDTLRVNGKQLRCKVFGEGGNLGMTQLGRVEFCLNGGACNTDFIDNAGGVDCSDHEVNAKILLNECVAQGDMTMKQRNRLLESMTENVAQLVLRNNYRQTQAISIAQSDSLRRTPEYRRLISTLHSQGRLDPELEFLPGDEALQERLSRGMGLTRPELAVLLSYAKGVLKEDLAKAGLGQNSYVARFAELAFPEKLRKKYRKQILGHRLRGEIVATQVANDMVDNMGITFAQRLMESTGAGPLEVARAYIAARDIYRIEDYWQVIESLDYRIPAQLQLELLSAAVRRVRRATRWFLRNRRVNLDPRVEVETFAEPVRKINEQLGELLRGDALDRWHAHREKLKQAALPESLAARSAMPGYLYSGLSVVEAARQTGRPLSLLASLYFTLGAYLELDDFAERIASVRVDSHWQALAREAHLDDLEYQLRSLSVSLVRMVEKPEDVEEVIRVWSEQFNGLIGRWQAVLAEVKATTDADFAILSVALRELLGLSQASQHCESIGKSIS